MNEDNMSRWKMVFCG